MSGQIDRYLWQRPGEEIIHAGFANKMSFWNASGGQLVLTTDRLCFTSRDKRKIRSENSKDQVRGAAKSTNASIWSFVLVTLLIPNAIRVALIDGSSERFVVWKREKWISEITAWKQP